jgi:hypothetical protein
MSRILDALSILDTGTYDNPIDQLFVVAKKFKPLPVPEENKPDGELDVEAESSHPIPLEQCDTDPSYQRPLDRDKVAAMVKDKAYEKPIEVNFHSGRYWVIDGQHRAEAARQAGLEEIHAFVHFIPSQREQELETGIMAKTAGSTPTHYHGTDRETANHIREHGIEPLSSGKVFLTSNKRENARVMSDGGMVRASSAAKNPFHLHMESSDAFHSSGQLLDGHHQVNRRLKAHLGLKTGKLHETLGHLHKQGHDALEVHWPRAEGERKTDHWFVPLHSGAVHIHSSKVAKLWAGGVYEGHVLPSHEPALIEVLEGLGGVHKTTGVLSYAWYGRGYVVSCGQGTITYVPHDAVEKDHGGILTQPERGLLRFEGMTEAQVERVLKTIDLDVAPLHLPQVAPLEGAKPLAEVLGIEGDVEILAEGIGGRTWRSEWCWMDDSGVIVTDGQTALAYYPVIGRHPTAEGDWRLIGPKHDLTVRPA